MMSSTTCIALLALLGLVALAQADRPAHRAAAPRVYAGQQSPAYQMFMNREVTFHLDDDLFLEQTSFMQSRVTFMEAKDAEFQPEEMVHQNEIVSFKLFDFDLLRRLVEKSAPTTAANGRVPSKVSLKVRQLEDFLVLLLQPLAYWVRMPLERSLLYNLPLSEQLNADFTVQIDLAKLQTYLRSNFWLDKGLAMMLERSNRCVKHELNKSFQLREIFSQYAEKTVEMGYDFGGKYQDLSDALAGRCLHLHTDMLRTLLEPLVPDTFDLNKMLAPEEQARRRQVAEANRRALEQPELPVAPAVREMGESEADEPPMSRPPMSHRLVDQPTFHRAQPTSQDEPEPEPEPELQVRPPPVELHLVRLSPAEAEADGDDSPRAEPTHQESPHAERLHEERMQDLSSGVDANGGHWRMARRAHFKAIDMKDELMSMHLEREAIESHKEIVF